ncbi:MAG: RCC1 domain-containing protein, partial [Limnohabitans sp.]|nr:RCC1 domain-containing protein [Limnohabitans sp.]
MEHRTASLVAVRGRHLLALRSDGSIYVWTSLTDNPNLNVPGGIGTAVQIAAGYRHSVALNSAGRVFCWGENNDGQCNIPADIGKVKKIAA